MKNDRRKRLLKDPHLPWPGVFPYDRLNAALARMGRPVLGTDATSRQVHDAFFDLMAAGRPAGEDRAAWDDLRLAERRLLVDFFLYEVPEPTAEALDPERWTLPIPLDTPDFRLLADEKVDLAALAVPPTLPPTPPPQPLPAEPMEAAAPPLDLGDLCPDLELYLRPDDEPG